MTLKGLHEEAQINGCQLGISGASAASLPTVDMARYALASTEIRRIEGILNGTSNYILTRMSEGQSYAEALKEAQAKGIAEPDPSMDVEGWDTAFKILIITNAVFGTTYRLEDISVTGIEKGITFETDTMGTVTAIGGRSSPMGAAAALLKDLINIYQSN